MYWTLCFPKRNNKTSSFPLHSGQGPHRHLRPRGPAVRSGGQAHDRRGRRGGGRGLHRERGGGAIQPGERENCYFILFLEKYFFNQFCTMEGDETTFNGVLQFAICIIQRGPRSVHLQKMKITPKERIFEHAPMIILYIFSLELTRGLL